MQNKKCNKFANIFNETLIRLWVKYIVIKARIINLGLVKP